VIHRDPEIAFDDQLGILSTDSFTNTRSTLMRVSLSACIICIAVVCGVARAAPNADVRAAYKTAAQLDAAGDYDKALAAIDQGLAAAPQDLPLLGLKGAVLLKLRDYEKALAAYQTFLAAGAKGADRREAQKIVDSLRAVQSTFLEITANGPAAVYLDSRSQGVFCTAAPSCNKRVLPGDYRVIAERDGFERWTGRVTVENDRTAKLAIALVEKPSQLTVDGAPPGAKIAIDGAPADGSSTVAAGTHEIVVSLAGYADARVEATAHEGKPVAVHVALSRLVPVRVEPAGATLALDNQPLELTDGSAAIPPGAHVLIARAPGFQDRRVEVPADRAADYRISIDLAREVPRPRVANIRKRVGIGLVEVAAGVYLGVGVATGVQAEATPGDDSLTKGLLVAGGALALTGVLLWLTAPDDAPQTARIIPFVGEDRAGIAIGGRF
jgi:hypothetical protein